MGWFGGKSTQAKQVESAIRIATNLYERTKPRAEYAPAHLHFSAPDSQYRYLIFCLSTMQVACASRMKNPDAVLNECMHLLTTYAVTEAVQDCFGGSVDPQDAANRGATLLHDFLHRWSAYVDIVQGGNRQSGTRIVCSMLRTTESNDPAGPTDAKRLWPLAVWIENALPVMRKSFT